MNTKSETLNEEEAAFLSTTPETIYFGRYEVKLSRAARLMRSLNLLSIQHRQAAASELGITPTLALEGEDELAGEAARTMNAAALPEGSSNAFESFGNSKPEENLDEKAQKPQKPAFKPLAGTTFAISGNISLEGARSFTCTDLRDEKLLHTARPVLSLEEAKCSGSFHPNTRASRSAAGPRPIPATRKRRPGSCRPLTPPRRSLPSEP